MTHAYSNLYRQSVINQRQAINGARTASGSAIMLYTICNGIRGRGGERDRGRGTEREKQNERYQILSYFKRQT